MYGQIEDGRVVGQVFRGALFAAFWTAQKSRTKFRVGQQCLSSDRACLVSETLTVQTAHGDNTSVSGVVQTARGDYVCVRSYTDSTW